MALKLKTNLLIEILNPNGTTNKYTKSLLNLKTILKLEKHEKFNIPKDILKLSNDLIEKENKFINNIPLLLIERVFYSKINNLNSYINLEFNEFELNMKTNELLIILENYYNEMFFVASLLASYYNLEIKINETSKDEDFI